MTDTNQPTITKNGRPLTLCLSASGGGHFRQLLDIQSLWNCYPHFFVTESTALSRSFESRESVEYVPHFALGQARMGQLLRLLGAALYSLFLSARIIFRRRPDVVITTGAGSQTFLLIWARLAGSRIIMIDSFARFDRPSKFARFAGWLAHVRIAQSLKASERWPGSAAFDPLIVAPATQVIKETLLVAMVGTVHPFDRLCRMVVDAKRNGLIKDDVVLQTGPGGAPLSSVESLRIVEEIPFQDLETLLSRAQTVICHGGTGSLITALAAGCRVIAVPRLFSKGEHYDDHQLEIVDAFEERGLIRSAHDDESLRAALAHIHELELVNVRLDQSALIAFIINDLGRVFGNSRV